MAHRVGIDAVSIERAQRLSSSFISRYYSPSELKQLKEIANKEAKIEFIASRFAAKEALLKAMGVGLKGFSLNEISVEKRESGEPYFKLEGSVLVFIEKTFNNYDLQLSITHEKPLALAMVYLEFTEKKFSE